MSRVLVVGATGMVGSHLAADLTARGDEVTVMARREPTDRDPAAVAGLPRLIADYTDADASPAQLEGFDAVVFAAGSDIRHVPEDQEDAAFWERTQSGGVPRFAARAKAAGVGRFVQIGSYYHQLHPEWAERIPYVAARREADERTRALSDASFAAITLNPPSIVGADERGVRRFARMIAWARGEADQPALFAPPGGTNYMSMRAVSQAVQGALDAGEPGKAYLIGDVNLRYVEYFQLLADRAGSSVVFEERDEEHPFQPDRFIVQVRGAVIAYEPDAADTALLGYQRDDVVRALDEIIAAADAQR